LEKHGKVIYEFFDLSCPNLFPGLTITSSFGGLLFGNKVSLRKVLQSIFMTLGFSLNLLKKLH
jgi:hypothetical protein